MSMQLRGRRSGAFWSLLVLMTITALGIGYFLGAQRAGAPLIHLFAQAEPSPKPPTGAEAITSISANVLATALTATLTAQPTIDQAATATIIAVQLNTAVSATLTAWPQITPTPIATLNAQETPIGNCIGAVRVEVASLYQGPGDIYAKVGEVHRGEPLTLLAHTKGKIWIKVSQINSPGDQGWISGYLVGIPADCW